jgi:hypothetical protein
MLSISYLPSQGGIDKNKHKLCGFIRGRYSEIYAKTFLYFTPEGFFRVP